VSKEFIQANVCIHDDGYIPEMNRNIKIHEKIMIFFLPLHPEWL